MKDFTFSIPTKIIFGKTALAQAGTMTAAYGSRVLILYGSSRIEKNGLLAQVTAQLAQAGVVFDTFSGIRENPTLAMAEKACAFAREKQVDGLLAIGGGSVIDLAKAVSIGACNEGPLWDYYEQKRIPARTLPLGVILTMAATASEANCVSVICNEDMGQKLALRNPLLCPKFALMNPELTYTVPLRETAAGAVDIFAHAFERYFHLGQRGTLRTRLCAAVMETVVEELPKALKNPEDYDSRSQLMWAATVAHSDMLGFEGVYACHAMSHVITGEFGISHGGGLAMLMPAWCKFMLAYEPKEIARFAGEIWHADTEGKPEILAAQEGISRFQDFICSCALSVTLREAGIVHCDSLAMAKQAMGGAKYLGENFRPLDVSQVQMIFELAKG